MSADAKEGKQKLVKPGEDVSGLNLISSSYF